MYSRFWMRHFLPEPLVNDMLQFGFDLNKLQLSPTQIYILCALQVVEPGECSISAVYCRWSSQVSALLLLCAACVGARWLLFFFCALQVIGPLCAAGGGARWLLFFFSPLQVVKPSGCSTSSLCWWSSRVLATFFPVAGQSIFWCFQGRGSKLFCILEWSKFEYLACQGAAKRHLCR